MITVWIAAAAALTVALVLCGLAAFRRDTLGAVVAAQLAGTLATVILVCLTVGFQRAAYSNLPIVAAVLNWVGGLVYVRFLDPRRA